MIIMCRIKYSTYEKFERGEFTNYLDSIYIYNEEGDVVYIAKLTHRTYNPKWFSNFISNPEEDLNRIMIYELQDGAKLMLRKYRRNFISLAQQRVIIGTCGAPYVQPCGVVLV